MKAKRLLSYFENPQVVLAYVATAARITDMTENCDNVSMSYYRC